MSTGFSLTRRGLFAGAAGAALAGCGDLIGPPAAPALYLLQPAIPATPGPRVTWALSIPVPDAPDSLDTRRIALTRPPGTMDYYANAAWPDHLPLLVQTALVTAFENSGRIAAVARDSDGARADYILQTELRDFEARYGGTDGAPAASVQIVAKLISYGKRNIVATLKVAQEAPASENSVAAAVAAFDAAAGAALAKIVAWALAAAPGEP